MKMGPRIYEKARLDTSLGEPLTGDALTLLRTQSLGMTQATLASHLGVAPHSISDWERAKRPIPLAHSLAVRWLAHQLAIYTSSAPPVAPRE